MLLGIRHATHYTYEPDALNVALRLKLFPAACASQTPKTWKVTVNDMAVTPLLTDGAGDRIALWNSLGPVGRIEIVAEGEVETTDAAGVLKGLDDRIPPGVYLRETPLTVPSPVIEAIAGRADGDSALGRLHALSEQVSEAVQYAPGTTGAATTAAEAAALGSGVCQDQAHVFVAAARSIGVPARYVAGYVLDPDTTAAAETHAWAEAHVEGLGWVGFDITHQLCPTDAYVRLASGLDAADAAPVRGTVTGETEEELSIEVRIAQAGQSQQ